MIADEIGEFLKFFDNVGYQLACLLDIDGQNGTKRSYNRQKISLASKTQAAQVNHNNINNSKAKSNVKRGNNNNGTGTSKRPSQRAKIQQQSIPARRRKKVKVDERVELAEQQQQHDNINNHQDDTTALINNNNSEMAQTLMAHHQTCDIQSHIKLPPNSQVLVDGPITLDIVDELQPLDHGSSISPVTHLSPMDPSIQFTTPIHHQQQQNYYPNQRSGGHLDSYQLHDEFTTSHEPISITNSSSHINHQDPHHHQQQHPRLNHQHIMAHQQQAGMRPDCLDGGGSALASSDCYPSHHQNLHEHHNHHHQNQHHHHHHNHHHDQQQQQQQPHHHHVQYHQLDQQWLGSTTHSTDNTLQVLGTTDPGALDHVGPLSPTNQSLDQVQFAGNPLYHHGGYYNNQAEHLDSFQNITDDYVNGSADPLTGNSSSALENLHRLQESTQTEAQQLTQHLHNSSGSQIRSMSINGNGTGNDNYDQHHHHDNNNNQQQQHQHQHHHHHHNPIHHHHQQHHSHVGHVHHTQPEHQMQNIDSTYGGHLNHHHHNHHHQHHHTQHQVMPLINGLVEPAGVIIQDINLASASWSSPEDLYSI